MRALAILVLLVAGGCHAGGSSRDPLVTAFDEARTPALAAAEQSLAWLDRPASHAAFPCGEPPVTHAEARSSVAALCDLLRDARTGREFADAVNERFVTRPRSGVLFTGYFAPEYRASRSPTDRYRIPLYALPPEPQRYTRTEIDDGGVLEGLELVWLEDTLDAYLVHVNGSARLRMPDGTAMHVGHVATNERAYTSLGRLMIDAGLATEAEMSMQTIRVLYERAPERVLELMRRNDRYVFFREIDARDWPRGSLGVRLTPEASIATDKTVFPAACPAVLETAGLIRLVFDQDTGGAIKGPRRADIYFGAGDAAGEIAGRLVTHGRLTYLLLKDTH